MFGFTSRPATLRPRRDTGVLPERLTIGARALALTVTRNPRAKRMTLRITRDGSGVTVTVPPRVGDVHVADFIARHTDWLRLKIADYPDRANLAAGMKIPVFGQPHRIVRHDGLRGTTRVLGGAEGPELHVTCPADRVGKRVADFLKLEARRAIEPLALDLARKTGKKARSIRFKDTSSRWGSCTSDGHLSFSWRIAMAPQKVVHYLVAHEVAHLTHMNHGPDFWALTADLCPDMEACKAWLKRNGSKLQSIGF